MYFKELMILLLVQLNPSKIIKELEGEKEVKGGQKSSQNIRQIKKPSLPVCEQQYLGLMTLFVQTGAEKRKFSRLKNIAVMWTAVLSQLLFWSYLFAMTNLQFQMRPSPHTWQCLGSLGTRTGGTWSPAKELCPFPWAVPALLCSPKPKPINTEFPQCISQACRDAHTPT